MADKNTLDAAVRTEFGKGAARRTRRSGQVPAVLYGHGTDPQHLALDARLFAKVLRENGTNAILYLNIDGKEQIALTKSVVVHPIRRHIEHADLLVIKKGEKVTVDIPVIVTGDAAPGTLVSQDTTTISVEADALAIPESFEISVEGLEAGTQILAGQLDIPAGATLQADAETLLVNITVAPVEEEPEAAEGEEGDAAEGEAEGDAAEGAADEAAEA